MTQIDITIDKVDVIPAKNMLEVHGSASCGDIPIYPSGGWPVFIVNPPLLVEDVAGDIVVETRDPDTNELLSTKTFKEDPLAAVVETIRENIESWMSGGN